jgi:hypothetical protein
MALLNPPDIIPEAMRYLVRALLALRQSHADRDDLVGLVAPPGLTEAMSSLAAAADLTDAEPEDLRTGGAIIARRSLDALRWLGIVEQDGGQVTLSSAAADQWKKPGDVTPRSMCSLLLDAVLRAADSEARWGAESGSSDLAQATVLLHSAEQPLLPFDRFESGSTGRSFATWELKVCGSDRTTSARIPGEDRITSWPVPDKEQWLPFRRWAAYLGLARPVGTTGLIPDASEALILRLTDLQPGDYDIGDFVGRCAQAVPVLDGGLLWREPEGSGGSDAGVLSGGLSISLLQLEADGFITMTRPKSDTARDGRILRLRPDRSADRLVGIVTWHTSPVRRGGL